MGMLQSPQAPFFEIISATLRAGCCPSFDRIHESAVPWGPYTFPLRSCVTLSSRVRTLDSGSAHSGFRKCTTQERSLSRRELLGPIQGIPILKLQPYVRQSLEVSFL